MLIVCFVLFVGRSDMVENPGMVVITAVVEVLGTLTGCGFKSINLHVLDSLLCGPCVIPVPSLLGWGFV